MIVMEIFFERMWRLLGVLLIGLLSSCAHHEDVRPSKSGVHKVVTDGTSEATALENAKSQALDYCDAKERRVGVISQRAKLVDAAGRLGSNRDAAELGGGHYRAVVRFRCKKRGAG